MTTFKNQIFTNDKFFYINYHGYTVCILCGCCCNSLAVPDYFYNIHHHCLFFYNATQKNGKFYINGKQYTLQKIIQNNESYTTTNN
jgi:hypothetical protein